MVISLISVAYIEEDGLLLSAAFLAAIILIGIASAAAGETIGACKMPNDNNREMLTEVVALYLAAHMKAQAAVITLCLFLSRRGF